IFLNVYCACAGWVATTISRNAIATAAVAAPELRPKIKFRGCLGFAIDVSFRMLRVCSIAAAMDPCPSEREIHDELRSESCGTQTATHIFEVFTENDAVAGVTADEKKT